MIDLDDIDSRASPISFHLTFDGHKVQVKVFANVSTGTIIEYSQLGGKQPKIDQAEFDSGMAWRYYPTLRVKEFFESWKDKYMSLEWIPVPNKDGKGGTIWVPGAEKEEDLQVCINFTHCVNLFGSISLPSF